MNARFHGVAAALVLAGLGALSCRAREGDRCICADDCRDGLVCLAGGRVLAEGACSAAIGPGADLGVCVDEAGAGEGDEGVMEPEIFLDLGSKRDFEPGLPPEPSSSDSGSGDASTTATGSSTSTDGSSSTASDSGTSDTGSSGSGSESGTDSGSSGSSESSGSSGSSSSSG